MGAKKKTCKTLISEFSERIWQTRQTPTVTGFWHHLLFSQPAHCTCSQTLGPKPLRRHLQPLSQSAKLLLLNNRCPAIALGTQMQTVQYTLAPAAGVKGCLLEGSKDLSLETAPMHSAGTGIPGPNEPGLHTADTGTCQAAFSAVGPNHTLQQACSQKEHRVPSPHPPRWPSPCQDGKASLLKLNFGRWTLFLAELDARLESKW